jgi:hypothetical protein
MALDLGIIYAKSKTNDTDSTIAQGGSSTVAGGGKKPPSDDDEHFTGNYKRYNEKELAKELNIQQKDLHRVKNDILKEAKAPKSIGKNPDIGVSDDGKIVLISRQTGQAYKTSLNKKWFVE